MHSITFLQNWYRTQCNGEWEHQNGVTIESLDNPGWMVTIDLASTPLQDLAMDTIRDEQSEGDWLVCEVEHNQFRGAGDYSKLAAILEVFQKWVEGAKVE